MAQSMLGTPYSGSGSGLWSASLPNLAGSVMATALPEVDQKTRVAERLAPMYRVICHDDPITTMEFVVEVLRSVFRTTPQRAVEIMLGVHQTGAALVGRYPKGLAERRVTKAKALARAEGYPLTFSIEKDV